jgi:3-dehydroquinate dehydratase-1
MNDLICISIPVTSGKLGDNLIIIKEALKYKPDFIELRFDFIDNLAAIGQSLLAPLIDLIKPNCPCIFTFRSFKEGGKIELDEEKRLQILKMLINSHPNYLDIEMETQDQILSQIVNSAIKENVTLIFSHHNLKKTVLVDEAHSYITLFINKLKGNFHIDKTQIEDYIYKIIFTAEKFVDNLIPLNLCAILSKEIKIISFCIGKVGVFSRIFCTEFGSFFTYSSLEEETAQGQIKIEKIRKIRQLFLNI